LKNPENMEKIKNLAAMFGGDGAAEEPEPEAPAPRRAPQPSPRRESEGAGGLPIDPEIMRSVMKIAPALSRARQEDDSTRLLRALRPFLGESRKKKLDEAVRIMQLIRMVPFLKSSGIF
jgi:hypothetical protein